MLRRKEQYSSNKQNRVTFSNHLTTDIEIKEELLESDNDEVKFVIKTEQDDISDESESDAYVTLLFEDLDSPKVDVKDEIEEETKKGTSTEQKLEEKLLKLEEKYLKSGDKVLKNKEKVLRDEEKILISNDDIDEIQEEELIIKAEPVDIHDEIDIKDESYFLDFEDNEDNDSNDVIDDEETETADEDPDVIDVVSLDDDDFRPTWWIKPTPPIKRIKTILPVRSAPACVCPVNKRRRGHRRSCPAGRRPRRPGVPRTRVDHIQCERQRRVELRTSFQRLQDLVPGVSAQVRVSKVVILAETAKYCEELRREEADLQEGLNQLLIRQQGLLGAVTKMRTELGMGASIKRT